MPYPFTLGTVAEKARSVNEAARLQKENSSVDSNPSPLNEEPDNLDTD